MAKEIILPMEVIEPVDPKLQYVLFFGESGIGKSTITGQLAGSLHLGTDKNGMKWIAARKLDVTHFSDLHQILEKAVALRKSEKEKQKADPTYVRQDFGFVALDTLTYFIPMCIDEAENIFSRTMQGKNWFQNTTDPSKPSLKSEYGDITGLPNGHGWAWVWKAVENALDILEKIAWGVILVAHTRTNREDDLVDAKNIDLPGKIIDIVCRRMEAVAHLSRTKDNKVVATFAVGQRISAKSKAPGLDGAVIVLSEKVGDKVVTHWDRVFTYLKKAE
jgi:energy-coupling factor transporter ATP-binding protein EcfA2